MNFLNKIILLLLFLTAANILISQSKIEKRIKKADLTYEKGEYYSAILQYNSAARRTRNRDMRNEIYFKIAEAYYQIFDYRKAKSAYRRCIRDRKFEYNALLKLGEINIQEGNLEEAEKNYQELLEKYPEDSVAQDGLNTVNLAIEWSKNKIKYNVELAKHLNSREDDYCPYIDEKDGYDHIYFTSIRKEAKGKRSKATGSKLGDIFITKFDKRNKWSDPIGLDSLNTTFDEGTPFIGNNGKDFYFTRCVVEKGKDIGCQIYVAQKVDGEWMNPQRVEITKDSISMGHPTMSYDGSIIYFSARLKNGYGGADIWYSEKKDGAWSNPQNMGSEINSKGDEMFPFMRENGELYYSSTKPPTMGSLDIFKATQDENGKWKSENLQTPFNSNSNDYGIYFYAKEEKGYFTSDRKGSRGNDIYYFELIPVTFRLSGTVKDKDNNKIIDSTLITLYGSDGSTFRDTILTVNKKDTFSFRLKKDTEYVFITTKMGYFNGKSRFSTKDLEYSNVFNYEILLESYNKTFEIPNIEFEFGQWQLTESSKRILDSIINIMNENPFIVIELSAHTDMIGTNEANMLLSQKRANSVTEYFQFKGIANGRLTAIGHGKSKPKIITNTDSKYPFLPKETILSEEFINSLTAEQQIIANQQNRRIEMKVVSNDYMPDLDY